MRIWKWIQKRLLDRGRDEACVGVDAREASDRRTLAAQTERRDRSFAEYLSARERLKLEPTEENRRLYDDSYEAYDRAILWTPEEQLAFDETRRNLLPQAQGLGPSPVG